MEWWYPLVPKLDGLLRPVSCGERPFIDGVRTPVAYTIDYFLLVIVVRFPVLPVRTRLIYPSKMRMHNISAVINDN